LESNQDFLVVGGYPPGQVFDICREAANAETLRRNDRVGYPNSDPVAGAKGPLVNLWPKYEEAVDET
jgi:uncharacterized protein YjlB